MIPAAGLFGAQALVICGRVHQHELDRERRDHPYPTALLEEARRHPESWVYEVVGGPTEPLNPTLIRGAWKIDAEGRPTGDYLENPNFHSPA